MRIQSIVGLDCYCQWLPGLKLGLIRYGCKNETERIDLIRLQHRWCLRRAVTLGGLVVEGLEGATQ